MIPESYQKLIKKLVVKTRESKTLWNKTSGEDEYKLELEQGAITIDNYKNTNRRFVDFRIWNDKGDVIDGIVFPEGTEDYQTIIELHSIVKRKYYKVDEIVNDIFKELDNDKIIGKEEDDDNLPF